MLTLMLTMFCHMPSNVEREETMRDAMALEGFSVEGLREYQMLDLAGSHGFNLCSGEPTDDMVAICAHDCY